MASSRERKRVLAIVCRAERASTFGDESQILGAGSRSWGGGSHGTRLPAAYIVADEHARDVRIVVGGIAADILLREGRRSPAVHVRRPGVDDCIAAFARLFPPSPLRRLLLAAKGCQSAGPRERDDDIVLGLRSAAVLGQAATFPLAPRAEADILAHRTGEGETSLELSVGRVGEVAAVEKDESA